MSFFFYPHKQQNTEMPIQKWLKEVCEGDITTASQQTKK